TGMLVEMRSIEISQACFVLRKMRRNPIENYADTALVKMVDQEHEIIGIAKARRRRKVSERLISPRSVEGMLHDRHQFHMGVALFMEIITQASGQLAIAQP